MVFAVANTVFNDVNDVTHLTALDEGLLRLLYLDTIEPGMSRVLALYRLGKHLREENGRRPVSNGDG